MKVDMGGPICVARSDGRWYATGVMSTSWLEQQERESYTFASRLSKFYTWISKTVKSN
jgi:hypothetical protein